MTSLAVQPPNTLISLRDLTKIYGPTRVVDGVSIDIAPGSIHALLGENGAGKSTLIKLISGAVPADGGHLELEGFKGLPGSVADAQNRGIAALPQELLLVSSLTASDNIFLGHPEGQSMGVLRRKVLRVKATQLLADLGQKIPMDVPVGELSAVAQTMVAVARALARDARVLILDEPTAALTDTETEQLFAVLERLRDEGRSIIYVSHRLEEVFRLADTATVMRNGRLVWTRPIADTNPDDVVTAMIGRSQDKAFPPRAEVLGQVVLQTEDIAGHTLSGVSIAVRSGRVLGIAGLAGSGRSELLKQIAGVERPSSGRILLDGEPVGRLSISRARRVGIALVPEERRRQGLVLGDSIRNNLALANLSSVSSKGVVSSRRERALADRAVQDLRIKAASISQPVSELSGGNQQKVVLAKFLHRNPRVLLLDEPTRGIDVGTKSEIYALIRRLTSSGVAVVVVSSEIVELIGLADEIVVLHQGAVSATVDAAAVDEETVLRHCYRKVDQ